MVIEQIKMMSKCSLSWNEFSDSVSKTYRNVRNKEDFSDVTIVGNDQKPVFAHKLVISGGSQYFESLLRTSKHNNVLLCLDGINSEQLNNLLDYIYFGEAQVYQDQLHTFLQLAHRFRLRGLLKEDLIQEELTDTKELPEVKNMGNEVTVEPIGDGIQEFIIEEKDTESKKLNYILNSNMGESYFRKLKEVNSKLRALYTKDTERKVFICKVCGKEKPNTGHMTDHVEYHVEGLQYQCGSCDRIFSNRQDLRAHKYQKHRAWGSKTTA